MIRFRVSKIRPMFQLLCFVTCFVIMTNSESFLSNMNDQNSIIRGIVIDAGSRGSTLHIYSWKPRVFSGQPLSITIPEANEVWSGRVDPGIASFYNKPEQILTHLGPLMEFAKSSLIGLEDSFDFYPIYFKATGGMRELPVEQRDSVLHYVREYLLDKEFCPFHFKREFARVISGEEEAIFSWAATNFLMGSLLPSSTGGGLISEANRTYGTLDLSDSSAQIAFYVPSSQNDKTDGLFNLQIGNQKHWNVYTKSFLQFGMVSARTRHLTDLVDHFLDSNPVQSSGTRVPASAGSSSSPLNYCFHAGYSENAVDSTGVRTVEVSGPLMPLQDQLTRCTQSVRELMERKFGRFCSEHNHGDCTIGGAYQPALSGETFVGHSSYRFPWKFLLMPRTADLQMFRSRAELICSMNFGDLLFYFESHNLGTDPNQLNLHLPYYCFMASFVLVLLQDGFRFKSDQMLTVLDDVPGSSAGWSLGAMLHEINDMSWEQQQMHQQQHHLLPTGALHSGHHPWGLVVIGSLLGFALGGVAAVCIYKEVVEDKGQQERGGSGTGGGDYDYESLSRLTAMELLEAHAVGGAGAVYKHKSGSSGVAGQSSSPVSGSPSNATMRKSSSSAVSSPYASPTKTGHRRPSATSFGASTGIAETEHGAGSAGGNALFKNMADFRPFQRSGAPNSSGNKHELLPTT